MEYVFGVARQDMRLVVDVIESWSENSDKITHTANENVCKGSHERVLLFVTLLESLA